MDGYLPQRVAAESDVSRRRAGEDDVRGDSTRRPRKTRRGLPERRRNREDIRVRTRRLAHCVPRALPAAMSAVHAAIFDALHAAEDDKSDASSPSPDKSDASSPSPDKSDAFLALARQERRLLALARQERRLPRPRPLRLDDHQSGPLLPSTAEERADRAAMTRLLVALCAVLGLACLTAALGVLARERVVGSKHLQLAGLSPSRSGRRRTRGT